MAAVVDSAETMEMSEETATVPTVKSQLPWVEKYRPNSLDELIAHEEIIQILNRLIESNKLPHLLFHGPPGICN
jgi:replication factor C subunit 3/5